MPAIDALALHWREYAIEAAGLALFMVSASVCVALLEYPSSALHQRIVDADMRRLMIGLAMGLTAVAIVYSPWGKRSGAHINPAITLTFLILGKVARWDAVFYVLAQFFGASIGMLMARALLSLNVIAHPSVNYVETLPGVHGPGVALLAEFAISFGLMLLVLAVSNVPRLNRYTGIFAGALVASYITFEAPLSGMSMNPARSFGSAVLAQDWRFLWIYIVAPPLGMLLAAWTYVAFRGSRAILCCKMHHENNTPCIFRCNYHRE